MRNVPFVQTLFQSAIILCLLTFAFEVQEYVMVCTASEAKVQVIQTTVETKIVYKTQVCLSS